MKVAELSELICFMEGNEWESPVYKSDYSGDLYKYMGTYFHHKPLWCIWTLTAVNVLLY